MIDVDSKDLMLIEELKRNSKLSEAKLAKRTNIPMTTVHNRIRKLRELGVIRSYTIKLDYAKLGTPLVAYALIKTAPGSDPKELLKWILMMPRVVEAAMIAGEHDIFIKVQVASMEELNDVVVEGLRKQRMIAQTRTMISYRTFGQ